MFVKVIVKMSDPIDEKSIKVIMFDGTSMMWRSWSEKFLARAKRRGYKELVVGSKTVPKKSDESSWSEGDKKVVERNDQA